MALQLDLTLENGINIPEAYIKIVECQYICPLDATKKMRIIINVYKDVDARFSFKPEVVQFIHECLEEEFDTYFDEIVLSQLDTNILTQSYKWLKTLSIYGSAINILDIKQ